MTDVTIGSAFAQFDTSLVSDALESLGLSGVLRITPLWPCQRIAGRVRTVLVGPADGQTVTEHLGVGAIETAEPGDVILVDNQGRLDVAAWGGLLSFSARQQGVVGCVVYGAVRDLDEAIELQFPLFGLGTTPLTARRRVTPHGLDEPLLIDDVVVSPRDWLVADSTGVVIVPADRASAVVERCHELAAKESAIVAGIRTGKRPTEAMKDYESMLESDGSEVGG